MKRARLASDAWRQTETCGGTIPKCANCWEVESRLADYLRDGGGKARGFVLVALNTSASRMEHVR